MLTVKLIMKRQRQRQSDMQLEVPKKKSLNLSLTPLIDVVFLLLIFFMLASTFSRFSSLPLSVNSGQSQNNSSKKFILVRVDKEGLVEINGQKVSIKNLITKIDELVVEDDMKLFVKVLEGATVQHMVSVLQKAKQSKIKNPIVVR